MKSDAAMESAEGPGAKELWERYCRYHIEDHDLRFGLDVSRVRFDEEWLARMIPTMKRALDAMRALEAGAVANTDERRMVGHYWLRAPEIAPNPDMAREIRETLSDLKKFSDLVHDRTLSGESGKFEHVLHIGIGGSALGPQFLADALRSGKAPVTLHFMDNTDPQGISEMLASLGSHLGRTLVVVVSKSGETPEPRNAMMETMQAYDRVGLEFSRHAVAVTMAGSPLDEAAKKGGWLRRFPMWDWIGGRTSTTSVVGLLPLALVGGDVDGLLRGAGSMDRLTRRHDVRRNPAAMLALMWHHLGGGRGRKDMVILPYKDRLILFSRYLQQLVMESLGKELSRRGVRVEQGIAVYGNKGSTDQHAYVQQLRDGVANFFVTFLQVLNDGVSDCVEVAEGITSGDYLCGFLLGTRRALFENNRDSITIAIDRVDAPTIGALIALFERAVGLYAELVDINAYHQPGVEAGKAAAAKVLVLQSEVAEDLSVHHQPRTAVEIADSIGRPEDVESVYRVLQHLAANPGRGVVFEGEGPPGSARFVRR